MRSIYKLFLVPALVLLLILPSFMASFGQPAAGPYSRYNPPPFDHIRAPVSNTLLVHLTRQLENKLQSIPASGAQSPVAPLTSPAIVTSTSSAIMFNNDTSSSPQNEESVAISPADSTHNTILGGANDYRNFFKFKGSVGAGFYSSTNGGSTIFKEGVVPSVFQQNQGDPAIDVSSGGTFYYAMVDFDSFFLGGFNGITVARTSDLGITWKGAQVTKNPQSSAFDDKPWIAVDRTSNLACSGNIYATWTRFDFVTFTSRIMLSKSGDLGVTWSVPIFVAPASINQTQFSYPAVGPSGELYVAWVNFSPSASKLSLQITKSTDCGLTFGTVQQIVGLFAPVESLADKSRFRIFTQVKIDVDRSTGPNKGAVYATWEDCQSGVYLFAIFFCRNSDIRVSKSTDGGATWPLTLSINPSNRDQFFPSISVDDLSGIVTLAWYDSVLDIAPGTLGSPTNSRFSARWASWNASTTGFVDFRSVSPLMDPWPDFWFGGNFIGDYIQLKTLGRTSYVHFSGVLVQKAFLPQFGLTTPAWNWDNFVTRITFGGIGLLRVFSSPAVPTTIKIDGTSRNDWGLTWVKMPEGMYMLSFTDVVGFITPTTVSITIFPDNVTTTQSLSLPIPVIAGKTTVVMVPFQIAGFLKVETSPPVPATIFLNGLPANPFGLFVTLQPTTYSVSFEAITGLKTPPAVIVTISAGITTRVIGNYTSGTTTVLSP